MDPITAFLILAATSLAMMYLAPGPKDAKPGDISSGIPKSDAAKKIPVIFGKVWVKNSSIVWFGDVFTRPIKGDGK